MPRRTRKRAGRVGNYTGRLGTYEGGGDGVGKTGGKRGKRRLKITHHAKGWQKSRAKGRSFEKPKPKSLGKGRRKR